MCYIYCKSYDCFVFVHALQTHMHTHTYLHTHIYVCIYICMHLHTYKYTNNLPYIHIHISIQATVHHYDSDHSRPSTPNQRCASRASQIVYGVSDEEEEEREREKKREHIRTPTPVSKLQVGSPRVSPAPSPRRLHKTISGALDITEDVGFTALGSNPNLAKIWHHAYRKELLHESSSSRGGSPYMRHSPLLGVRNHLGTKLNHSVGM